MAQVRSQQSATVQSEPGQPAGGITLGFELGGHDETPLPAEKHVSLNRLQQVSKLQPVRQRVSPGFGSTRHPACGVHWKWELPHVSGWQHSRGEQVRPWQNWPSAVELMVRPKTVGQTASVHFARQHSSGVQGEWLQLLKPGYRMYGAGH